MEPGEAEEGGAIGGGPIVPQGTGMSATIGLIAGGGLVAELLDGVLRDEGFPLVAPDDADVALVVPPETLVELQSEPWSSRLAGVSVSSPMVIVSRPSMPVHTVVADRVHLGRASIIDASTATVATIVSVLHLAAGGRQVLDPPFVEGPSRFPTLSSTEWSVLELLAAGLSNQAIAQRRFVAERTVETHVRQIFAKLGLADGSAVNRRVLATRMFLTGE